MEWREKKKKKRRDTYIIRSNVIALKFPKNKFEIPPDFSFCQQNVIGKCI